ncbi:MAG: DNA methyltransferase [Candidatus Sedimenticola sp. 6PFRAG5]
MNAVEIEEAITNLAEQEFDPATFPFAFLEAFGNPATTIKRLKSGSTNKSDVEGGVLQRNNIHIAVCEPGTVSDKLIKLKDSPATTKAKAKFVVATDGVDFEAEDLTSDLPLVVCSYQDFPDHFGFFLPLAGISTVKQIRESSFDIKATGRLNRLYVQLIQDNPEWGTTERRHDMNHFMARLIFCFFAEDTDIFNGDGVFTETIGKMSERDSSNTHEVMSEIFRAMDTKFEDREAANLPRWANGFPYVNGGLFSGTTDVPRFSKIARSYLIHIGNLDWTKINPDIFGSMIQAVTDEEERGALGLHYTSVPNILKVLNPLFLDDLKAKLEEAGDNSRKLLNLRNRMAKIRIFDPACGSGNFLVISYKEMRAIEAEINQRRGEAERRTDIPLTNFRGIELRDFPAEIARLALIIAEYQCDVLYRGQKEALDEFLPLNAMNWIINGNALRLDWLKICPPTGIGVKLNADDLFGTPLDQAEIDFENEGGETYICGNPPYVWSNDQGPEQKEDLKNVFSRYTNSFKSLNYVTCWFVRASEYAVHTKCSSAFVSINTICQGSSVGLFWPVIFELGREIVFAHTSFKWRNLASNNAGVTVVIVGLGEAKSNKKVIYSETEDGTTVAKSASHINAYLIDGADIIVKKSNKAISSLADMKFGNKPVDGGNLLLSRSELDQLGVDDNSRNKVIKRIIGAAELVSGVERYCLWIEDKNLELAISNDEISERIERVKEKRLSSRDKGAREMASQPHQFREMNIGEKSTICIPAVSSEGREFLPIDLVSNDTVISNRCYGIFDGDLFNFSILSSKMHIVWIGAVCGRLELRYSYTSTLGWNTFPISKLTEKNKEDLTRCAEEILLSREAHYPATIADLYDPEKMPDDLRRAHERNDEVLERIYIGRRFKNDTERLEKLFDLYTKMISGADSTGNKAKEES